MFAFVIAFTAAFVLTPPTILLAKRLHLVTDGSGQSHPAHTHRGIIPRAGGLPVLIAILIATLLFIPLSKIMTGILLGSILLVIVGLFDDYVDISPYVRFVTNILIAVIVVSFGLGIPYISNPLGGVIRLDTIVLPITLFGYSHHILLIADILAVIWLAAMMNAINWSKGVDGQLPGFVGITALCIGLFSQRFTSHDISTEAVLILAFITSGAFLGFLPWNFYPQKIMPGYGGGSLAGFLLGVLAIISFGKVGTAILVLSLPLLDAFFTIIRRLAAKKSPFRSDWGHFHHRLLEMGWGRRRIAVFYWMMAAILGTAGLTLAGWQKLIIFLLTGLFFTLFTLITSVVKKKNS